MALAPNRVKQRAGFNRGCSFSLSLFRIRIGIGEKRHKTPASMQTLLHYSLPPSIPPSYPYSLIINIITFLIPSSFSLFSSLSPPNLFLRKIFPQKFSFPNFPFLLIPINPPTLITSSLQGKKKKKPKKFLPINLSSFLTQIYLFIYYQIQFLNPLPLHSFFLSKTCFSFFFPNHSFLILPLVFASVTYNWSP